MHNWRFIIPVLAVIGAVASFSERTLVDVRQQCFERLERDSPISRSESGRSERLSFVSSFSDSTLETRENRRCHSDRTREFLNHRRSNLENNRADRPQIRNIDSRIAFGDRKISPDSFIERSDRLASASRGTREITRDVENRYQTTIHQFDSRRDTDQRRSADNRVAKSDIVIGTSRKTRSLERVPSRANPNLDAKQQRSRSVLELLNSRSNDQESRFPEEPVAERLVRTTRMVPSRNNEDTIKLSPRLSTERRTLMERESLNTPSMQKSQTRQNRNEGIGFSRIRSTSERMVRVGILSRNSEEKTKRSKVPDSKFRRQNDQRSYSTTENFARLTMTTHNTPGFKRDIEDRTSSSARVFESRAFLIERRFREEQYRQKSERFNNNRIHNERDERFNSQTRTEREINMHRTRSIDAADKAIVHSLNIRDERIRHRSKSLNAIAINMRREQNIRSPRSDLQTNFGILESGLQRNRITRDLNERFNENLRELRAREESLHELRQDRISRRHMNDERPLIARFQINDRLSRFSRTIDSQLRRTETRRIQSNSPSARETSLFLKNEERLLDVRGSSRLENRVDLRNRQARAGYGLSQSEERSHLGTRPNARIQSSQSIERIRDDFTRTNRRQALERTQIRDQRTRSTFSIRERSSHNSQYAEKIPRRQSLEEIYLERFITELSPLQNARLTVRLSPKSADFRYRKEILKGENHASNRVFGAEVISARPEENIFEKNLNNLEWKTLTFYVLQSAYVCAILFHIIGGSGFKGNNHKINAWMPTVRHSIKVD